MSLGHEDDEDEVGSAMGSQSSCSNSDDAESYSGNDSSHDESFCGSDEEEGAGVDADSLCKEELHTFVDYDDEDDCDSF